MTSIRVAARAFAAVSLALLLPASGFAQARLAAVPRIPGGVGAAAVGSYSAAVALAPAMAVPAASPIQPFAVAAAAFPLSVAAEASFQIASVGERTSVPSDAAERSGSALVGMSETDQAAMARLFDGIKARSEGENEDNASAVESESSQIPPEAAALHAEYAKKAAQRMADLKVEIDALKSGRFGVTIGVQQGDDGQVSVSVAVVLEGQPVSAAAVEAKVAAGEITAGEWETAKAALLPAAEALARKVLATLAQNQAEHEDVHRRMNEIIQADAVQKAREFSAKAAALQSWGLPITTPVGLKTYLRYAHLYRLDGSPTDLGEAVHDLIAPFVAADPAFLSRVTVNQFNDAVQYLSDSLRYSLDLSSPDGRKRARRRGTPVGYDYPEMRKALVDKAREVLTRAPEEGDGPVGFAPVSEERHATGVLRALLKDAYADIKRMVDAGAGQEAISPSLELARALHSAMGIPVPSSQGAALLPVQHKSLLPILAELKRRQADESVVASVIRSFPLGESLLRLGVHKLWDKGVTGKGVVVAFLDNGVDFEHPDFEGVKSRGENLTRDRGIHTKGDHGTPMADILHAIAPEAEIHSYQVLSNSENLPGVSHGDLDFEPTLLKAMDRAVENGASILSVSLGRAGSYSDTALAKKVAELAKKGVLVVVSAGNAGRDLPKGYQVGAPATSADAIAVGAVDYHGKKAAFSSEGPVFNPTDLTISERPDVYAYGVNVKAAAMQLAYGDEIAPYEHGSGTSPAAPHVSAVLALAVQAAREAGSDVAGASVLPAARIALTEGTKRMERLPVLVEAEKVVDAFVALLSGRA